MAQYNWGFIWKNLQILCSFILYFLPLSLSRVAQRKRAGPITQRSVDRNHPLLHTNFDQMNTCDKKMVQQIYILFIIFSSPDNFLLFKTGPVRESNPGPRAPEARIIPLDQQAECFPSQRLEWVEGWNLHFPYPIWHLIISFDLVSIDVRITNELCTNPAFDFGKIASSDNVRSTWF